jgi:outer membrane murein-binding lipoprotein Lpp
MKAMSFFVRAIRAEVLPSLLLAGCAVTASGQMPPMPKRVPVAEQLAAVPDLERGVADLEKTLDAAADQKSLMATTARYILEVARAAK